MSVTYPLFKVHIDKEAALSRLSEVFDSGFINEGEQVRQLGEQLAPLLGGRHLVLMNSCTSALTVALRVAGVGPGRNVVSSPMTCIASNTPVCNLGGEIRWADVSPDSGMVTPETIARAMDERTVAVLFVDWAGVPPDLESIRTLCRERGVPMIQDAAHAFMAEYAGRPVAEFADMTCFSFQAIKHFTCGDGGALVCHDQTIFDRARKLKWFGYDREKAKDEKGNWKAQQQDADILDGEVGYKFNMNNVAAAIGLAQLPHMPAVLARHRANAAVYDAAFASSNLIKSMRRPAGSNPAFWVYTALLTGLAPARDELLAVLGAEGIHAGQVHVPNDDYSCFTRWRQTLPGVRAFSARQVSLPCGWWLGEDDCAHIARRVLQHLG